MARSHPDLWLWLGGTVGTVGAVCLGVALTKDQTQAHYALWTSTPMIGAYVAFGFALICFVCAALDIPIPLARSRSEGDLVAQPLQPTSPPLTTSPSPPGPATSVLSGTAGQASAVRTFAGVRPVDLVEPFKTHSSIQAQKLVQPYFGQWLQIEQVIEDIGVWVGEHIGAGVSLKKKHPGEPWVMMYFRDKMVVDQRLSVLRRGTRIRAIGKIDMISAQNLVLTDCELL